MKFLRLLLPALALALLVAHSSRHQMPQLVWLCTTLPVLLLIPRRWVVIVFRILLLAGAAEWLRTAFLLTQARLAQGQPWFRMILILGSVALFTAATSLVFRHEKFRNFYRPANDPASVITFFLTAILLGIVQRMVQPPLLLFDRFWPGTGWIEILLLATWAAWLVEKLSDPQNVAKWRLRVWLFFSIVFFAQLILGLAGIEKLLMTGALHLPIPALILAGPIYRGTGFFMPLLFLGTVLILGPAWCSHLCYIGAWDNLAATHRPKPVILPQSRHALRLTILILVICVAWLLNWLGISASVAAGLAIVFGLGGIGLLLTVSRRTGVMTHCSIYCPLGLVANWLGRISPFRIQIDAACTECGACRKACRYDALHPEDLRLRRPNHSCTLCGDCVEKCPDNWINYRFLKLRPARARLLFIVLAVTLHAVFLGLARI